MNSKLDRAPAIFFGHGSPMNALGGPYVDAWSAIGQELQPRPRAVLMISAHWQGEGTALTGEAQPRTIHDFGGFPPALHAILYPAPGSPELAQQVAELIGAPITQDWGLDHGAWSVLMHVFPKADVPIVQLRLDHALSPAEHYALGKRLAPLRDEGVLIAGSGDVVHNLSTVKWGGGDAYDWAESFNARVRQAIASGDHQALLDFAQDDRPARLSIPTDEHWTPLLYVLGAAHADEVPSFFNDAIDLGSISMLGAAFGVPRA